LAHKMGAEYLAKLLSEVRAFCSGSIFINWMVTWLYFA
jgi:hypothetical protein